MATAGNVLMARLVAAEIDKGKTNAKNSSTVMVRSLRVNIRISRICR